MEAFGLYTIERSRILFFKAKMILSEMIVSEHLVFRSKDEAHRLENIRNYLLLMNNLRVLIDYPCIRVAIWLMCICQRGK